MYKVVIVDDEPGALAVLSRMVGNFFDFEVVGEFSDGNNLIEKIAKIKPHVLFLDIHLGDKSGIDIARELFNNRCEARIVLVSAYDKYAIQAFEYNIIDYLLKPVGTDRMEKAINKIERSFLTNNTSEIQSTSNNGKPQESNLKRLNTQSGFLLVDPDEIVSLEADHVYTKILMARQNSHYVAQNIGRILSLIDNSNFLRISRSNAINARFLREVNRTQRKCLIFDGKNEYGLAISKTGMNALDEYFG
jgi:DNA-binding LytR/AlgR family response regulator